MAGHVTTADAGSGCHWGHDMAGLLGRLAGYLLPLHCRLCSQPGDSGLDLCLACRQAAWRNVPACARCALPLALPEEEVCGACLRRPGRLLACHAAWRYGPTLDALVRRYKFEQDLAAGAVLAGLMLQQPPPWLEGQVLMPVPLHRTRLAQRGYDQAHELACLLATGCGLRCVAGLRRQQATAAQSGLDQAQRRRNLRGAFVCAGGRLPESVVLVDDVMTTGATLEAAARALMTGGVRQVRAWVAARTV